MAASRPRLVFFVDMNSARGDKVGSLLTLASDPMAAQLFPPSIGETVEVVDDDGDLYLAVVEEMDGNWLGLSVKWETCIPNIPPEAIPRRHVQAGRENPLDTNVTYAGELR
jgi:hypothetical protein